MNFAPPSPLSARTGAILRTGLGLLCAGWISARAQPFTDINAGLVPLYNGAVVWGDYDADGDLDLLTLGGDAAGTGHTRLYRNDSGVFNVVATPFPGLNFGAGAWADVDGDGDLDVAVAGYLGPGLFYFCAVYRNQGGTFVEAARMPFGSSTSEIAWGDADGDGDLDLLLAEYGGVFRNDQAKFSWQWLGLPGVAFGAGRWADYDNDGDQDMLLAGNPGNNIMGTTLYRNLGQGVFVDSGIALAPASSRGLAWGDCDNDGDLDLLRADLGGMTLYLNSGNGTLVDSGIIFPPVDRGAVAWGDYDNDGWLDAVVAGSFGTQVATKLYRNLGGGTGYFSPPTSLAPVYDGDLAWGDYDNDGDLDLALTGYNNGPVTRIYRNDTAQKNTPPTQPTGMVAVVRGNSVTLSWNPTTDSNQVGGLSYNVRLTEPFSVGSIMPPMAHLPTGRRLLPAVGNAGQRLSWTVTNLPPSPFYYWAVQAIDHSYAGSSFYFTASNYFTISRPPTISDVANQSVAGSSVTATVPFTVGDDLTAPANLIVTAASSDTNLVPAANVELGGSDSTRNVRVTPVPRRLGTATITLTVTDEQLGFATDTFVLNVTNTPPTIAPIPNQVMSLATGSLTIPFTVGDDQSPAAALVATADASDAILVPSSGLVITGNGADRVLRVTPASGRIGTAAITVRVADDQGGSAQATFGLTVGLFEDAGAGLPGLVWGKADWVDYDQDGDLDIVCTGTSDNVSRTRLFRNGNGAFVEVPSGLPDVGNSSIAAWGDYNNDGWTDVLLAGYVEGHAVTALFRHTGSPDLPFANSGVTLPQLGNPGAVWGDIDNDGDLDLWLSGTTNQVGISTIYRNNGDGTFTDLQPGFRTAAAEVGAWGDADNDGDLDLLLRGFSSVSTGFATLYRNNGDGTFTDQKPGFTSGPWGGCAWGDYDNDGWLDVLMSGGSGLLYRNLGNGSFTNIGVTPSATDFAWGDVDQDGWRDVLEGGVGSAVGVRRNDGSGGFPYLATGFPPISGFSVAPGDYDQDGDLDILCLGAMGTYGALLVFRNTSVVSNPPPATPAGLAAVVQPDASVVLSWERPADIPAAGAAGLSYQLRVGTTPNGVDVMSPSADPISGFQRVPGQGNVGPATRWRMVDLPVGTYYWSVQAIDPGLAASRFATEGSFTITNTRPRLIPPGHLRTSHGITPPPLAFSVSDTETPATDLLVTARSSNTGLVPDANLILGGSGAQRTIQVVPVLNQTGAVTVVLAVRDGGGITTTGSFPVTITNAAPFLSNIPNLSTTLHAPIATVPFLAGDLETSPGALALSVTAVPPLSSLGTELILARAGTNHFLAFRPPPTNPGRSTIKLTVRDAVGASASDPFVLNVVNPPPVITEIPNQTVAPGAAIPPIPFAVSDDQTPAENLSVTVSASSPVFVPGTHLVLGGSGGNRVLNIVPPPGWLGSVVVSVNASDSSQSTSTEAFLLTVGERHIPWSALPVLTSSSAAWGDCDNDGFLDLFLTGRTTNSTPVSRLFHNNGDGTLTDLEGPFTPVSGGALWGDYDNDGYLDVLVHGTMQRLSITTLYHNNGDGTFAAVRSGLPTVTAGTFTWVDFDHDGRLDVFFVGLIGDGQSATQFWRNTGRGWFVQAPVFLPVLQTARPAWGDYDNDGDPDLLLTGRMMSQQSFTRLYRNDRGSFSEVSVAWPAVSGAAAWGDYDADGRLDLALSYPGDVIPPVTRIYRNLGGGVFTNQTPTLPPVDRGTVAWADYDNDGRPDLLLAGFSLGVPSAAIYRNNGDGTFPLLPLGLPGISQGSAALGDADQDGDLDLLLTGGLTVLRTNEVAGRNTPPTPPDQLDAMPLPNGSVVLSWRQANDAETTNAPGLGYNLRVGTRPGAQDALAPDADLQTGRRRQPAPGNAGPGTSRHLRLAPGTYFWSVQAVDPTFAGSTFAPEGTFAISDPGPVQLAIAPADKGRCEVRLTGQPGLVYRIEASEDLQQWTDWLELPASTSGEIVFEHAAGAVRHRFYRARAVW